jgi:cation diffusion facilitator family transporter
MTEESTSAITAAFAGNAALAVLKGMAAGFTGSAAMLAETFHSIADTGNQVLLFLGMRLAKRPPDARHPFGHGRDVYFWAFVVAVMLFTVGGAFSIWEGVRRLLHPIEQASSAWTWGVLGGGFIFETVSFTIAFRSLSRVRAGRGLAEYWRDSRDPTLVTVLFEDAAALISLLLAATGLALSQMTDNAIWDAAASLAIGCVLLVVAGILALENYSLLLGEAAPPQLEREIRRLVQADAAVVGLRALRTMALGPHEFLVALEIVFARDLAAPEIETAVRRLERAIIGALRGGTRRALVVIEPASPQG